MRYNVSIAWIGRAGKPLFSPGLAQLGRGGGARHSVRAAAHQGTTPLELILGIRGTHGVILPTFPSVPGGIG